MEYSVKLVMSNILDYIKRNDKFFEQILWTILKYFGIIFIWLYYEQKWLSWFNQHVLEYLNISSEGWLLGFTLILLLLTLIGILKFNKYRFIVSVNQLFILCLGCLVYLKYRFSGLYSYYGILESKFAYSDVILLMVMIIACVLIRNRVRKNDTIIIGDDINPFLLDQPIANKEEDLLDYQAKSMEIAEKLRQVCLQSSWSMGIVAPWGGGKSSFVNLLKKELNKKGKTPFLIITYNPRNASTVSKIQEDFFLVFSNELKPYNSKFISMFRQYMEALNILDDNNIISKLSKLTQLLDKESIKEKISNALKELPCRVIIFIEDLDRLLADEIIEVLKIIDGNAAFANTIFVTSYDKSQVNRIIDEKYKSENNVFTDKFFSYEFVLPLRPYENIHTYLKQEIVNAIEITDDELSTITAAIDAQYNLLSKYITTLRDAKRFINLFVNDLILIKKEVDFTDFFLLSIIKYKDVDVYKRLYNKEFVIKDHFSTRYSFNAKMFDRAEPYHDIINKLFPSDFGTDFIESSYRRIFSPKAFDIYFVNQVYGMMKKEDLIQLLHIKREEAKRQIDIILENKRQKSDLIEFLTLCNYMDFNGRQIFENFVWVILYTFAYPREPKMNVIIGLLDVKAVKQMILKYNYQSVNEYIDFVKSVLDICPPYYHKILGQLIINSINGEFRTDEIIFSKNELLELNKKYLETSIKGERDEINRMSLDILYSCISDIDSETKKIVLDGQSCEKVRSLIMENPEFYISNFVRLGAISSNALFNSIACEPFWRQIFGSNDNFKNFIEDTELDQCKNINRVRNFWKLYEKNDFQMISVDGEWNVEKEIENDLRNLMQFLEELKDIDNLFAIDEAIRKDNPDLERKEYYQKRYMEYIDKLKDIKLNIKYKASLFNKINEQLVEL